MLGGFGELTCQGGMSEHKEQLRGDNMGWLGMMTSMDFGDLEQMDVDKVTCILDIYFRKVIYMICLHRRIHVFWRM